VALTLVFFSRVLSSVVCSVVAYFVLLSVIWSISVMSVDQDFWDIYYIFLYGSSDFFQLLMIPVLI